MGFFSDLKEDLSQAVTELSQEDIKKNTKEMTENLATSEEHKEPEKQPDHYESTVPETVDDLSKMLDQMNLDNLGEEIEEKKESNKDDWQDPAETILQTETVETKKKQDKFFSNPVTSHPIADETAVITAGMKIAGDITSEGSLDIIGDVTGNINIMGKLSVTGNITGNSKASEVYAEKARINGEVHSEGSLKIGQNSIIIGNIYGMSAVIAGAVKGDIDVHGPVVLDTSAIVMGNIKSKSVQINNGAVIEGMCSQTYADVNPTSFFDGLKKPKK